ncbi:MAG: nucleotide exchange factor GrpE [Sphaerospermopsis sp. SIO1G2]|nr:nucleotide exchange factor GrpE [Sphaerospermopsis sp. SIO1G1]NET73069.1 nucleotide exchange factor GrpE [Sphaerospermopsis sp. SIO1G2]
MINEDLTSKLKNLMQKVGITNFKNLSFTAGISESQILGLRRGKLKQMKVEILLKIAEALEISLNELITTFSDVNIDNYHDSLPKNQHNLDNHTNQEVAELKKEYERVNIKLEQQQEILQQEFQQSSLQILESLLLFWPTAAQKAKDNPQLPAVKILALVQKPLDQLLQAWGVETIASVGDEIPYNPQLHQILQGKAEVGEIVKVCYVGYRQGDKLLYRAKVSPN